MNDFDIEPIGPDSEEEHFVRCEDFKSLNLNDDILKGIEEAGFKNCTPIQSISLPHSLEGKDVIGKAQTGTGKTAAFLLTVFKQLLSKNSKSESSKSRRHHSPSPRSLILAPTRELASQILQDGKNLGKYTGLKFSLLIGGVDYQDQHDELSQQPDIVIATPGRLIDFFKSRKLNFQNVDVCVIDEADRMFDMGFYPDIRYLMRKLPPYNQRQTLLFSATMSYRVTELSYEFMNEPIELDISSDCLTVENIEEKLFHVSLKEKLPLLLGLLKNRDNQKAMIFCNTKSGAQWLGFKLKGNGFLASVLTGDVPQKKRLNVVRRFKDGKINILVATDVASRGLHVDDVSFVVNYDLPEDPENYVHRIGRTGRAGKSGEALTLACERFVTSLPFVEELISHKVPSQGYDESDLVYDRAPRYVNPTRSRSLQGKKHGQRPRHDNDGRPRSRNGPRKKSGNDQARDGNRRKKPKP